MTRPRVDLNFGGPSASVSGTARKNDTVGSQGFRVACSLLSGAGALMASTPSQAAIMYSGLKNLTQPLPSPLGTSRGQVTDAFTGAGINFGWSFSSGLLSADLSSASSNLGVAYAGLTGDKTAGLASSYALGDPIGTGDYKSSPDQTILFDYDTSNQAYRGHWALGTTAFAGVRAATGSDYRYGWMRITTPSSLDAGASLTLVDWGFETELNTPIMAGDGIPAPAPLPALGAAAALAASRRLRRRVKQAQAAGSAVAIG